MKAEYSLSPIFLAKALPPCFLEKCKRILYFREEKSLRHVVMVANFWMTTTYIKSEFALFQSYSISLNLSNVGEIFWG